jgi:hypothetical protein
MMGAVRRCLYSTEKRMYAVGLKIKFAKKVLFLAMLEYDVVPGANA